MAVKRNVASPKTNAVQHNFVESSESSSGDEKDLNKNPNDDEMNDEVSSVQESILDENSSDSSFSGSSIEEEIDVGNENIPFDESSRDSMTQQLSGIKGRDSIHGKNKSPTTANEDTKFSLRLKTILTLSIVIISALVPIYFLVPKIFGGDSKSLSIAIKKEILNKYQSQTMLKNVFVAIESLNVTTDDSDKSAVITVLYSHKPTAECFVNDVAKYASQLLRKSTDYLRLNGSVLNDDFSAGNKQFHNSVDENGVLVVYNFHDLSPKVVKHFHGICDTYSPYVNSKAVYLILLELEQENFVKTSNLMRKVNNRMSKIWQDLGQHFLDPLITRLSENIIEVQQENVLSDC